MNARDLSARADAARRRGGLQPPPVVVADLARRGRVLDVVVVVAFGSIFVVAVFVAAGLL